MAWNMELRTLSRVPRDTDNANNNWVPVGCGHSDRHWTSHCQKAMEVIDLTHDDGDDIEDTTTTHPQPAEEGYFSSPKKRRVVVDVIDLLPIQRNDDDGNYLRIGDDEDHGGNEGAHVAEGKLTSCRHVPSSLEPVPSPLVFVAGGHDNCTITSGLISLLIQTLPPGCCCCWQSTLQHIQQKDSWSCGYRNLQMLLSALLPLLPDHHVYWNDHPRDGTTIEIPSLPALQHCLEESWRQGYDPAGARYYQHQIVGKSKWLGAVEVTSLLNYFGIDATVVQFIKCTSSRQLLGPFCEAYFFSTRKISPSEPSSISSSSLSTLFISQPPPQQSTLVSLELVHYCMEVATTSSGGTVGSDNHCQDKGSINAAATSFTGGTRTAAATTTTVTSTNTTRSHRGSSSSTSSCISSNRTSGPNNLSTDIPHASLLPLYLQWKGHSVTVVGIQKDARDGYHLIVFDPMKSGVNLERALARTDMKPFLLDCQTLTSKDCQVVVSTCQRWGTSGDVGGTNLNKAMVQSVTAAEHEVLRVTKHGRV